VLNGRLADLNDTCPQHCFTCPAHAQCHRALVHADYNYYLLSTDDGQAQMWLCPDGYCQPINSSKETCSKGRAGLGCSECDNDHIMSLHFSDHLSCDSLESCINYTSVSVAVIFFTMFYVILLLLLLHLSSRKRLQQSADVPATTSHVTTRLSLVGCLFPLVYFYQLLPSVYSRLMTSSWWLDRVIQFFTSLFHLYPAMLASGRGLCLAEFSDDQSSVAVQRYFFIMAVYWSQLFLIVLFFSMFAGIFLCFRGPFTEQNIKMLVTYFLPAFLFYHLFSNVPLLRAGLQSVNCVSFNHSSVLYTDTTTNCYASWQVTELLCAYYEYSSSFICQDTYKVK